MRVITVFRRVEQVVEQAKAIKLSIMAKVSTAIVGIDRSILSVMKEVLNYAAGEYRGPYEE